MTSIYFENFAEASTRAYLEGDVSKGQIISKAKLINGLFEANCYTQIPQYIKELRKEIELYESSGKKFDSPIVLSRIGFIEINTGFHI